MSKTVVTMPATGIRVSRATIDSCSASTPDCETHRADLEMQNEKLRSANHDLQSYGRAVSHELKGHINKIYVAAQVLAYQEEQLEDDGKEMLAIINRACQKMADTITAIHELSRGTWGALSCRKTDLSQLASEIASDLQASQPKRVVDVIIHDGLTAECDPHLIRVVLRNLLGNAWKFSCNRSEARIEFGARGTEHAKIFFVKDNGIGFTPCEAHKLFIPYYRHDAAKAIPGQGIGLETARTIIERHGGRIWAEGRPDEGATIFFTI